MLVFNEASGWSFLIQLDANLCVLYEFSLVEADVFKLRGIIYVSRHSPG